MDPRLRDAKTALDTGRIAEAITLLLALVDDRPDQPSIVYQVLLNRLLEARRYREAVDYSKRAIAVHPRDPDILNARGVALRRTGWFAEALSAFDAVLAVDPDNRMIRFNRALALLAKGDADEAVEVFGAMVRENPDNATLQRQLGASLLLGGRHEDGFVHLRRAVELEPTLVDAWLDMCSDLNVRGQHALAEAECDRALADNPGHPKLVRSKAQTLYMKGDAPAAEALLADELTRNPQSSWLHAQLGVTVAERDPERGIAHLRRAMELDPADPDTTFLLIEALDRVRTSREGAYLDEANRLATNMLSDGAVSPRASRMLHETLRRAADFDGAAALGAPRDLGRAWAKVGLHTGLLGLIPRVETHEDRLELVEQHRIWGRFAEANAAALPIRRPMPRPVGEKIRLGFMSSDLRRHAVGYFALPLFTHPDRERFEVFVYSYRPGGEDPLESYVRDHVAGYRRWPHISTVDAAQAIADDDLDMLIELGGSTNLNKLDVIAHRPAPRQASWLGYPHSAGLSTIDHLICDPHIRPTDPALLVERPLTMPSTWLALGRSIYSDGHVIAEGLPQDRSGVVTFGTQNNPNKLTRAAVRAWARIVAAVPNARFLFVRPEAASTTFQANIIAEFAAEGVTADRLDWRPIRGDHMGHYNDIDITLDTFPLTGGTTTADALWMGVPVVTLVGEALYERLSYSMLTNAGVPELCAFDLEAYHRIAVELAADRDRRLDLRRTLRDRIKASPLGQTEQFAADFYDTIWKAVREPET